MARATTAAPSQPRFIVILSAAKDPGVGRIIAAPRVSGDKVTRPKQGGGLLPTSLGAKRSAWDDTLRLNGILRSAQDDRGGELSSQDSDNGAGTWQGSKFDPPLRH